MLVLTVKRDESIRLSGLFALIDGVMTRVDDLTVMVTDIRGPDKARLGVTAPREIAIDRLDAKGCKINASNVKVAAPPSDAEKFPYQPRSTPRVVAVPPAALRRPQP